MTDAQTPNMRAAAREFHDAGLCVLPIKADGTKSPDVRSWTQYKTTPSTPADHDQWFGGGRPRGIAVVYGAVSGGVEMLEFEGVAVREGLLDEVAEIMQASGLGDIWYTIQTGWVTESPSGGRHYRVRLEGAPVPPSKKLAARPKLEDEYTAEDRQRLAEKPGSRKPIKTLIETRGEGGYGVVEPSGGTVHGSGQPYVRLVGGPDNIPVITAAEMDAIRDVCRMVDQMPVPEAPKTAPRPAPPMPDGGLRPGDDFNARGDWAEILRGIFQPVITRGHTTYWGWADGARGVKATTGRDPNNDRLWVFTTSSDFEADTPYSKFGAYAHLHHNGDFKSAAADLRSKHYGSEPPRQRLYSVPRQSAGPFTDGSSALDPDSIPDEQESTGGPDLRVVVDKPSLDITNEADAIDGLLDIMAAEQLPDLYKRSSGPCWVYEDDEGNPVVKQLGTDNLRAYLGDHVTTYQVVKDPLTEGTKEVRELLMPKTCGTVLGRKDWPLFPLRGIVTSPVVRPDGTLVQAPGYDRTTGLYLHPRIPLRRLAPQVNSESVQRARDIVLDQMLADFPFVEDSDRAHYLGALLTPILRPYFHGPTPAFIITATAPGSGKSLLKDIFKYAYGIAETAWPENDTELRKSITTQLYTTGQPVVVLDNLPNGYVIKSPVLSSLLTAEHWGDRVLGSTASVTMRNDRVWIITGNGLRTGGDNGRRAMWVRLDPNCPDPDQRDGYKVGDLRPWLRKNASTVVAALVTMVRAWLADGAKTIRKRKGDYSEWASMMAGLLDYLDVPGWLDTDAGQDEEELVWAAFLAAWHRELGTEPVATGLLIAKVAEQMPRGRNGEMPTPQGLGGWLRSRDGRYFKAPEVGSFKPVKVWDSHRCQNLWRVEAHFGGSA
ncbi:bifunctional DNA primase/polymerase [Stenotrophomonas sp. NPDC087984]